MNDMEQTRSELQQEIGKVTNLMKWLLIGGIVTLGMALFKFVSGEFDPIYHSVEAAIGVYCLVSWGKNYHHRQKLLQKLEKLDKSPEVISS
ncbi:hypothetical protein ACQ86O_22810 [Serratia sp. L9]|uniref:hypothetical protein n=1 Tax=Serratia sp. L9 TaxID=3423946 RepID=UPI003D6789CE